MSTQYVRNIINTQVDSLIIRAKEEIKNEGKKKIEELKNKLPTPEEVKKKLQAEINEDSCSPEGMEKFMKIYDKLYNILKKLQDIIKGALEKIEGIENGVKPIFEEEGPIGQISLLANTLKSSILPILQIAILAAPILLAANSGPTSSGQVTDVVQQKRDKAISKTKEFAGLIASIPLMIMFYKMEAEKMMNRLTPIKEKISFIDEKITKLMLFMVSLLLQFEEGCNELNNAQNDSVGNEGNPIVPDPNGSTPLQQYMSLLKDQYEDIYDKLQEAGNEKALERIFKIKENLEEDYNISFKVINFGEKPNKL